jgi:tetratricopeptide (TPR) repeat protein
MARSWYGLYYLQWIAGRFEEGLEQATQAVQIDPLSAYARAIQAVTYLSIDLNKAIDTAHESLRIDPDFFTGWWTHISALKMQERFAEAAERSEIALRISGRAAWIIMSLAQTYARLGNRANTEALYMELRWRSMREYVQPTILALAACAAGEQDEAIRYVREADSIGDPILVAARYWPDFAELARDPRFQEILIRRGWQC